MVAADRRPCDRLAGRVGLPVRLGPVAGRRGAGAPGPLPQISRAFHLVGNPAVKADSARNAVILGCALIAATTVINVAGVRLLARINNAGVFAELVGVVLLIGLLFAHARRGPGILLETSGHGGGGPGVSRAGHGRVADGLVRALRLRHGGHAGRGDRPASSTRPAGDPPGTGRRGHGWALLIVSAILAVSDPTRPELGQIVGGLPMIVKDVLGPGLGRLFLIDVAFAVFVCALAVHAGTVRLIFAMARDNNLPMARALGHVPHRTQAPAARSPGRRGGRGAPGGQYQPAAGDRDPVRGGDRLGQPGLPARDAADADRAASAATEAGSPRSDGRRPALLDGSARPADQRDRGRLGLLLVINISWPRPEIYGPDRWGRFAAPLATLGLLGAGGIYYATVQRGRIGGTMPEHVPGSPGDGPPPAASAPAVEGRWFGRLAAND